MNFLKKNHKLQSSNKSIITITKTSFLVLFTIAFVSSCSKNIDYSAEYMEQTSGRYLYNQENVIDVFYENKKLFLNWGEYKIIEPVVLDNNTFFIADIYKKLHFVQHPETKERYLSVISEENEDVISYDYLKVDDTYKTPSMHLKNGNYKEALTGYLEIKEQDSTSTLIDEGNFNSLGYKLLRDKDYENAVEVFKMNVVLFPESANVYDSLADAYLAKGDSLQAFNNFKKTLEYNDNNSKAKRFVEAFSKKQD
ncbi:tetratricopeptide repeat protein [Pontimicrobium sp. SW4]|uniref:Tetratricopeptide repeat protein n=1 Tax=Pontimicrobium sp. SW4 TaxID=3153519 RepID=A0AAU7BTH6_9FLAO